MVRRASDEPRGVVQGLSASKKRDEELARAQGRGTTAMRDSAGNVIQMAGDAPYPLLRPMGTDASMAFTPDGVVKFISPDTLEDRSVTARDVKSSGRVDGDFVGARNMGTDLLGVGTVNTGRLTAGQVNIDPNGIATPGIGVGGTGDFGFIAANGGRIRNDFAVSLRCFADNFCVTGNSIFSRDRDGALRWNSLGDLECVNKGGSGYRDCYAWTFHTMAPSWRRLKTDHRSVEDYLGRRAVDVVDGLEIGAWRYNTDTASDIDDTGEHFGPMLDDMPDPLVQRHVTEGGDDRSTYDRDGLLAVALAAIQDQQAQIADLTARVDALERGERR